MSLTAVPIGMTIKTWTGSGNRPAQNFIWLKLVYRHRSIPSAIAADGPSCKRIWENLIGKTVEIGWSFEVLVKRIFKAIANPHDCSMNGVQIIGINPKSLASRADVDFHLPVPLNSCAIPSVPVYM